MKYTVPAFLGKPMVILFIITGCALLVSAQPQHQAETLTELRNQVTELAAIDEDPSTPESVRSLNAKNLRERRSMLGARLKVEVDGLRTYASSSVLTSEERSEVTARANELEAERLRIESSLGTGQAATARSKSLQTNGSDEAPTPGGEISNDGSSLAIPATVASPLLDKVESTTSTSDGDGCYPNPPGVLYRYAKEAAYDVFRTKDPEEAFGSLPMMLYWGIAHRLAANDGREVLIYDVEDLVTVDETKRTDKQIGASARANGSTSITEKPSFAYLLGLAVEHGAIDANVKDTTLTLSSSPYAFVAAFEGDSARTYANHPFLTRIGASASFNVSDENEMDLLANARRNQLSEWSVKFRLSDDRSSRSKQYIDFWKQNVATALDQYTLTVSGSLVDSFAQPCDNLPFDQCPVYIVRKRIVERLRDFMASKPTATEAEIREFLLCAVKQEAYDGVDQFELTSEQRAQILATVPEFTAAKENLTTAHETLDTVWQAWQQRPVYSLAYTNIRQTNLSDYSVAKFLYERGAFGGESQIVANVGASFYHHPDPLLHQQTLRDFAIGVSLQGTFGRSPFLPDEVDASRITYAFSGRYERFFENRFKPDQKADIAVAQFKVEIPFGKGMSFPFSVTYANATEFVKEDHVRAHFGFSFDADKLLLLTNLFERK